MMPLPIVIPAKAGTHEHRPRLSLLDGCSWIPAFAGMTKERKLSLNAPA
jgi:hypothetical protein